MVPNSIPGNFTVGFKQFEFCLHSETFISKWNAKLTLIWKDLEPLGNRPVLFFLNVHQAFFRCSRYHADICGSFCSTDTSLSLLWSTPNFWIAIAWHNLHPCHFCSSSGQFFLFVLTFCWCSLIQCSYSIQLLLQFLFSPYVACHWWFSSQQSSLN